jgi:hypothetical protein
MGVFYIQHPVHGIHVATTDVEAANCKANGWSDWAPGDADPVLSPRKPIPDIKVKSAESEVEVLKAQMAALLARLDAAESKVEDKPVKKAAAAPAVPDFLKDATKPQG